jgi:serine/tyrosine/threonine adenylyltransferase
VSRQAALIARWMNVGFIHGVMNTDNMAVSGESIDFGPCAFMDIFDPATVFSSIDERGRYGYANQPNAALWNLARFAETLLPLIDADTQRAIDAATEAIATFETFFNDCWLDGMRGKLGLSSSEPDDRQLAEDLLQAMQRNQADFTLSFRALCAAAADPLSDAVMRGYFINSADYDEWALRWRARMSREATTLELRAASMQQVNPAYIARNHRIEQVIVAAVERGDFAPFEELSQVLAAPYEERAAFARYANPPRPAERVLQTFCGT